MTERVDRPHPLLVRVVHVTPGRVRARVPREALENGALREAEEALLAVDGVREVRRNVAASSIVIRYDPAITDVSALVVAASRANVAVMAADEQASPTALPGQRSAIASWIAAPFQRADRQMTEATRGGLDLRTLVPIGLAVLAAREVLAGRLHMAPWYTLTWWAFDSYLKLQRGDHAVQSRND